MSLGSQLAQGWQSFAVGNGQEREEQSRQPVSSWQPIKTALIASATTVIAYPVAAQQAPDPVPLPPLNVEAGAKKKAPAKKAAAKKAPSAQTASPTPQAPSSSASTAPTPAEPGANPYANPNAPYQVERSASGKLTEPLLDTPRTVTAVPQQVIEDKKAFDLRELARQTPGVTITAGENGASLGSNFQIRGFNARNDIFVDGIRDPGSIGREVFSVQQLEIYKGPSGVISGRATPGGAFNFITKKPDLNGNFFEVATTVGTDETFRTTIDANQVITPDLAVRSNLMYHQADVAGRDFIESERWGGLFSVTARPVEDVKVTLDYYRYRYDGIPDYGVPVSRAAKVPFSEIGVPRSNFYGDLSIDYAKDESDVGTATVEAKLSNNLKLVNRTRVGANYQGYLATAPRPGDTQNDINGLVTTTNPQRIQDASVFANQTELTAKFDTGGLKHTMVAGVDVSFERLDRLSHTIDGGPATTTSILNPNPYRNSRFITGRTRTFNADIDDVGVYVQDTVELSHQWIINGGVRFDDFTRDQIGFAANGAPQSPGTGNTAKVNEGLWSGNIGAVYKPLPNASIYAAYGYTETPIGNEIDSTGVEYNGLNAANANLGPEETSGVEVGTKWELFNGRLLATAALFETIKDNARVNNPAAGGIGNEGKYRIRGVELGVAGNITDAWSVFGGVVLLDTKTLGSNVAAEIGAGLANTPLTQFSLLSKYQLTKDLSVGGQAIYQSEFYSGHFAKNSLAYHTTNWWRFDAFAEYEFDDHWTVEVSGLNLTDEVYYDSLYQAANTFATVAPGRTGYATVKWKY